MRRKKWIMNDFICLSFFVQFLWINFGEWLAVDVQMSSLAFPSVVKYLQHAVPCRIWIFFLRKCYHIPITLMPNIHILYRFFLLAGETAQWRKVESVKKSSEVCCRLERFHPKMSAKMKKCLSFLFLFCRDKFMSKLWGKSWEKFQWSLASSSAISATIIQLNFISGKFCCSSLRAKEIVFYGRESR